MNRSTMSDTMLRPISTGVLMRIGPDRAPGPVPDTRIKILDFRQHCPCPVEQGTPLIRQAEGSRGPVEQNHTVMRFKRREALRHGGCGQASLARGSNKAAFLDDALKQANIVDQHYTDFPDYISEGGPFIRP